MKQFIISAVIALVSTSASAEDITNQEELVAYLKKQMPDGQEINRTFKVGDALSMGNRYHSCMSDETLGQFSLPIRIAIRDRLVKVRVTKEFTGYRPVAGPTSPACEYEVTGFDPAALVRRGVRVKADKGKVNSVTIPLFKQRVLGATKVDLKGYVSISETQCDISFRPWFASYEPSKFTMFYKAEFKNDRRYKNAFSSEFQTSTWCFQKHYDGTLKWKYWSRL